MEVLLAASFKSSGDSRPPFDSRSGAAEDFAPGEVPGPDNSQVYRVALFIDFP